jgi:hypothetical protein
MGRSTPSVADNDPPARESLQRSQSVRLPPLRNGAQGERSHESEQAQARPNSNLWQLVDAATER